MEAGKTGLLSASSPGRIGNSGGDLHGWFRCCSSLAPGTSQVERSVSTIHAGYCQNQQTEYPVRICLRYRCLLYERLRTGGQKRLGTHRSHDLRGQRPGRRICRRSVYPVLLS